MLINDTASYLIRTPQITRLGLGHYRNGRLAPAFASEEPHRAIILILSRIYKYSFNFHLLTSAGDLFSNNSKALEITYIEIANNNNTVNECHMLLYEHEDDTFEKGYDAVSERYDAASERYAADHSNAKNLKSVGSSAMICGYWWSVNYSLFIFLTRSLVLNLLWFFVNYNLILFFRNNFFLFLFSLFSGTS